MKSRIITLTGSRNHPLRQLLPAAALTVREPITAPERRWSSEDARLFVMSFTAFFIAFSVFLL